MADTLGVQSARKKKVSHKLYGVALCKCFIRKNCFLFYIPKSIKIEKLLPITLSWVPNHSFPKFFSIFSRKKSF